MKNNFENLDYIEYLNKIEQSSVDFICIDPPYGKIEGMKLSGQKNSADWDIKIDWEQMFKLFNKVLKPGGTIAVFGQNPTYSQMILSNLKQFKYEYIWKKNNAAQGFNAHLMPLIFTENIAIFVKDGAQRTFNKPNRAEEIDKSKHFSRWYSQKLFFYINKTRRQIHNDLGHRKLEFYFMYNGKQFGLLSDELYKKLIEVYKINQANFFVDYSILKEKWDEEKKFEKNTTLDAEKYVGSFSNILNFSKDYKPYLHPTQKPIDLIKYLIGIYTNENQVVLDCFAGSGTTLLAAKQMNRFYLGCELDINFYLTAKNRIDFI